MARILPVAATAIALAASACALALPATEAADPAFADFCPNALGFALGRVAFTYDDEVVIWHGGSDAGESAIVFYSKATGRGLAIMANSVNGRKAFPALAATVTDNTDFASFLQMQAGS